MNHFQIKKNRVFAAIILLSFLSSCNLFPSKEEDKTANEYIYDQFKDWYLWYDKIPNIDPNGIATQEELIDSIKVPQDRWSFSASLTSVKKLFEGGQYTGFGVSMVYDSHTKKIMVAYVYRNSPAGRTGVERGWEVQSVNGVTADDIPAVNNILSTEETIDFAFVTPNQNTYNYSLTREEIEMNTVLYSSIINSGQHKIGYLVFDSFVETSEAELDSVFTVFKKENITDLIVDLRYNGGGLNDIAYKLTAMIAGSKVNNQVITMIKHNNKHSNKDTSKKSTYKGAAVELDRVFFITTDETASASELVINNLSPFMEVCLVGSNTHGKPVGMYIFEVEDLDLAILPICFKSTNQQGYGDYFEGLPATINASDDIYHNWGDPDENMLKTTVDAISIGAIASAPYTLKSTTVSPLVSFEYKGINKIIGAY